MKKSLFNFAATMLMSAGAVVFNACSDDNTDSDLGIDRNLPYVGVLKPEVYEK